MTGDGVERDARFEEVGESGEVGLRRDDVAQ